MYKHQMTGSLLQIVVLPVGSCISTTIIRTCILFQIISCVCGSYEGVCVPPDSPLQPQRPYPLSELHTAFQHIVEASRAINQRRMNVAESQPKGNLYTYVPRVFMGVQLDSLGQENFAQVLPAVDIALESVQNTSSYSGVSFITVPILHLSSIPCDSLALLAKLDNREINVLFGPLNDFSVASAARFTTSMYDVPVITPGGFATQLGDKSEYATLTRVFFTYSDLPWLINATMRQYGWASTEVPTPVGLYAARNPRHRGEGIGHTSLVGIFQQQSINSFLIDAGYKVFHITTEDYSEVVDQFLKRLPGNARISILCADPSSIRYVMLKARELGLTNGDYAFISIDLFSDAVRRERPWYQEDSSPDENERARQAYRALMTISLRRPDSEAYKTFSHEVRVRALRDYKTQFYHSEVRTFVGLFHDAVTLYTLALEDALTRGISITEGKKITDLMWNRTFEGVTGTVRIDASGDRNADYSLLDLDLKTHTFQPVANYFGNDRSMHPLTDREVDWIIEGNKPPPSIPKCGFDGSRCQNNVPLIVGAVGSVTFGVFIIVGVSLGVYFYRRAELQAISWIIDWTDLEFTDKSSIGGAQVVPNVNGSHSTDPLLITTGSDLPDADSSHGDKINPTNSYFGEVYVNREVSPVRSKRKSLLAKSPITVGHNTNSTDKRRGMLKFANESNIQSPTTDETPEAEMTADETSTSTTAIKRFQQRFARRSRINDDASPNLVQSPTSLNTPLWNNRSGARVQIDPLYMKSPSFDYSSVTSKQRHHGGRRKTEAPDIGSEWNAWESGVGRRKKDSQVSRHSTDIGGYWYATSRMRGTVAMYKGSKVYLRPVYKQSRIESNKETAVEVNKIKDLNNDHICRLIGVCLEPSRQCFVMEYCPKGSLLDFLKKEQFTMDWLFKLSLMQDICRGMNYLHQIFVTHGNLKSSTCLLDSRFAVKLTDFGLPRIRGPNSQRYEHGTAAYFRNLIWTAPELLPAKDGTIPAATFKGDVYSFAIICQELIYRKGPFYIETEIQPEPWDIIEAVEERRNPSYRPVLQVQEEGSEEVVKMIRRCWDDDPTKRPDFRAIGKLVGSDSSENLIDNLLERLQGITTNLEAMVDKRTEQYMDEKKRAEDLLYSMLPKSVASQLIKRGSAEAESFDMVTIYFSDIVGFTALSASSTPMEVVNLLNALYTLFDDISGNFCVYKVETIGDAYMVASGLPNRIGNEHAREIARMSIAFLKAIFEFQIPHRPHQRLELRIGVHSGPVCAGVVGQRMPRYCLFGDTVNTSSRMESNGLPLKIHISQTTFNVLRTFRAFIMTKRGSVEMKGKGEQTTYWLHGEESFVVDPVPAGEPLVGGPYDGAIGPIAAGALSVSLHKVDTKQSQTSEPSTRVRHFSTPTWRTPQTSADVVVLQHNTETTPTISNAICNHTFHLKTIPELQSPTSSASTRSHSTDVAKKHSHAGDTPERIKRRVGVCNLPHGIQMTTEDVNMTKTETMEV